MGKSMYKSFFIVDKLNLVAKECFPVVRFNYNDNDYLVYYSISEDENMCEVFVSEILKNNDILTITSNSIHDNSNLVSLIYKIIELPSLYTNKDDINEFIYNFCEEKKISFNKKIPALGDQELANDVCIAKTSTDYIKYVNYFFKNAILKFSIYYANKIDSNNESVDINTVDLINNVEKKDVEEKPVFENNNSVWSVPTLNDSNDMVDSQPRIDTSYSVNTDNQTVNMPASSNASIPTGLVNTDFNSMNVSTAYVNSGSYPNYVSDLNYNMYSNVNNNAQNISDYYANYSYNNTGFNNNDIAANNYFATGTDTSSYYVSNSGNYNTVYDNSYMNSNNLYYNNSNINSYYANGINTQYQDSNYQQGFSSDLATNNAGFANNRFVVIGTVCLILASLVVAASIIFVNGL